MNLFKILDEIGPQNSSSTTSTSASTEAFFNSILYWDFDQSFTESNLFHLLEAKSSEPVELSDIIKNEEEIPAKIIRTSDFKGAEKVHQSDVNCESVIEPHVRSSNIMSHPSDKEETPKADFQPSDTAEKQCKKPCSIKELIPRVILYGIQCSLCLFMATDQSLLDGHFISKHAEVKQEDERLSLNNEHLEIQAKLISAYKTVACEFCDKKFSTKEERNQHKYRTHLKKTYTCPKCGKTFTRPDNMKKHATKCSSEPWVAPTSAPMIISCLKCKKMFSNVKTFKKHKTRVHGEAWQCQKCGKQFSRAYPESKHSWRCQKLSQATKVETSSEHVVKLRSCKTCGKTFTRSANMKRHTLQCHLSTEVCDKLDQSFPKIFSCTICRKVFSTLNQLNDHTKRFHDDSERIWTCDQCGKNFRNPKNFRQHLLYCHRPLNDVNVDRNNDNVDGYNEETTLVNDWICGVCNRSFTVSETLKAHLKSAHEMIANFSCLICRKLFCFQRNLSSHNRRNHNEKKWKCDICPSSVFRQSHHLKRHKRLCHNI